MSTSNGRNEYFDVLKGIGILCVLYGHTAFWGTLPSRMVFSFHMPLFFLISGIFFDVGRIPDFGSLLRKVWRNLLLPYCFFVIVGSFIKYDLTIREWLSRPLFQLGKILHGEDSNSIWFLVCLAMVQILVWIVWYKFKSVLPSRAIWMCLVLASVIIASFVIHFLPKTVISRTPLMLWSVPAAMVFFATGRLFSKQLYDYGDIQIPLLYKYPLLVFSIALFIAIAFFIRTTFDLRSAAFSVKVLPACTLGLATASLAAKISVDFRISRYILSLIGSRSLYIFSLELPLSYIVSKMTQGQIPYPCWKTPHFYWIEPLRICIILILAFAFSYPTKWALTHLRSHFTPKMTTI